MNILFSMLLPSIMVGAGIGLILKESKKSLQSGVHNQKSHSSIRMGALMAVVGIILAICNVYQLSNQLIDLKHNQTTTEQK